MKDAMKGKQKERLNAIRAIQTAFKQKEVDDRIVIDDIEAVTIMAKMVKQRKESIKAYTDARRQDLVDAEQYECDVIYQYMPAPLSSEEISQIIDSAIASVGAVSVKDMGKVMSVVKPQLVGKADIGEMGEIIKKRLSSS